MTSVAATISMTAGIKRAAGVVVAARTVAATVRAVVIMRVVGVRERAGARIAARRMNRAARPVRPGDPSLNGRAIATRRRRGRHAMRIVRNGHPSALGMRRREGKGKAVHIAVKGVVTLLTAHAKREAQVRGIARGRKDGGSVVLRAQVAGRRAKRRTALSSTARRVRPARFLFCSRVASQR